LRFVFPASLGGADQISSAAEPRQGVTLFLNPNAEVQLPANALPCSSVFSEEDGRLSRTVFGFHPVVSFTIVDLAHGATDAP
jgi:hypothetical protein